MLSPTAGCGLSAYGRPIEIPFEMSSLRMYCVTMHHCFSPCPHAHSNQCVLAREFCVQFSNGISIGHPYAERPQPAVGDSIGFLCYTLSSVDMQSPQKTNWLTYFRKHTYIFFFYNVFI